MMLTRILASLTVVFALTTGAAAWQTPPPQQPPEKPVQQPAPMPPPRPVQPPRHNVKLDLTILDQHEGAEPVRKVVSLILADRRSGRVRTSGNIVSGGQRVALVLNVDAEPIVLDDNRIQLDLSVEYAPKPSEDATANGSHPPHLLERLSLLVVPGKPMVVSQASDPTSDRRITVELTATILK